LSPGTGLLLADLAGVAVFAASGGSAAVAKRLDLFGVVFWLHPHVARLRRTVPVLDAVGLVLCTVTGTLKALDAGVPA
jgi:uncharacterized membrane protein YeiH